MPFKKLGLGKERARERASRNSLVIPERGVEEWRKRQGKNINIFSRSELKEKEEERKARGRQNAIIKV